MSDEIKHTPGPWEAFEDENDPRPTRWKVGEVDGIGRHICLISSGTPEEHREGNAALIAAAPDLLSALEALLAIYKATADSGDCGNWDCETESEVIAARAAIAKAKGESK